MIKDVACLKVVVNTYYAISGQIVNLSKSQLMISPKIPTNIKNQIRALTHMHPTIEMWRYLGVPISKKALNKQAFSFIKEKMTAKIYNWK